MNCDKAYGICFSHIGNNEGATGSPCGLVVNGQVM